MGFHIWNVVILMKPSFVSSSQVLSCTEGVNIWDALVQIFMGVPLSPIPKAE